jgi:hypothetical protein
LEIISKGGRDIKKIGESGIEFPFLRVLSEDDWKDDGELFAGIGFDAGFPNPDHIAEEAQGDPVVFPNLMFEEEVDKAITSMEGGGEKEIALGVAEVRIDKAARLQGELLPRDGTGKLW